MSRPPPPSWPAKQLNPRLIVDASHANSGKNHHRQAEVALEIGAQLENGGASAGAIAGVMLESFLVGGAQNLDVAEHAAGADALVYGQSVTDACMDWDVTASVLAQLAASARIRRSAGPRTVGAGRARSARNLPFPAPGDSRAALSHWHHQPLEYLAHGCLMAQHRHTAMSFRWGCRSLE